MTLQVHALRLCVRAARVKFRLNFLKFLVHRPSIPRLPAQGLAQVADSKGGRRPSLPVLASEMFLSKSPFPEQNAHYLHFAINDNWADKLYSPRPTPFKNFWTRHCLAPLGLQQLYIINTSVRRTKAVRGPVAMLAVYSIVCGSWRGS